MKFILIAALSIISFKISAQQFMMDTVINKMNVYNANTLHEKLYVHTDRNFYLTGETMWFKVYYVEAFTLKPLDVSKIAYIEILDSESKAVLQTKISLDNTKSGSLFLPASINSGKFRLRAYTNWMKNFDASLFYEQSITIVNPFTKLGLKPVVDTAKYDVQFFPEGGNLVEGLPSTVAFRVVDQSGKGVDFKGAILNGSNDSTRHFNPYKFGMGKFTFTPEVGGVYKAVIIDAKGRKAVYKFPSVSEEGYVMHVQDTSDNRIAVVVYSKFKSQIQNPTLYLLPQNKLQVSKPLMSFMNSGKAIFLVDKKNLGEGISRLTVFSNEGLPVCERLYGKEFSKKIAAEIQPDQSVYAVRRKVNLNLNLISEKTDLSAADMSMAVYKVDSLQTQVLDIDHYLKLTSELKGNIESPEYYFNNTGDAESFDNLMLTHGWSRISWKNVLNYKTSMQYDYIPETAGHIITGKVVDASGSLGKGVVTYLSSPDKIVRLYLSRANDNGRVQYEMQNFYGSKEILVQTNNTIIDSIYKVEIQSPFSEKTSFYKKSPFDLSEALKSSIAQRSIHMQVQNAFYTTANDRFVVPQKDSLPFYGKPDETYMLDDFTRFPTMEEVMREYVPGVAVRIRKGKFHFVTLDMPNKSVFEENPLVLLDGMPIFDIDKIMAFDPRKIKKLDVMTRRYYLGALSFGGLVSYSTYKGDLGGFVPDAKSLIINYEGLQPQREFFSPRYETQQRRESTSPDTRTLLYWSPNVKANTDGKATVDFFTSDLTGKFQVVLQGITSDGKPISASSIIDVKDKANY